MKTSKKYFILFITNFIIAILGFLVDWDSWGAIIPGVIILVIMWIINPILTFIVFKKDSNKFLRVLIGLIISIVLFCISCDSIRNELSIPWMG